MKRTILILVIVMIFCGSSLGPIYVFGYETPIIDSYPESNWDGGMGVGYVNPAGGQSFIGDGRPLNSITLYCCKWLGATGTCHVKLYKETHSIAFGVDSIPSGSALATSDGVSLSDIPDALSYTPISFNFSSPVTLTKGAYYVLTLECSDPAHQYWEVFMYLDQSSPTHPGNHCYLNVGDPTWHTNSGKDLVFYAISNQTNDVPDTTEIILDNAVPGQSGGGRTFTGTWCASSAAGYYGTNSLYSCGSGKNTYRWTPIFPEAGSYNVYVWWTAYPTRSTSVPISVTHAGGTTTKTYNQQTGGGQWVLLGNYSFNAGTGGYVEISDIYGQACADAVRFAPWP